MTENDLEKLIEEVDNLPNRKWFLFYNKIISRIARIIFVVIGIGLLGYGYYLSEIAVQAAVVNLLELSVALDSLSLSSLAVVIAILALVTSKDWKYSDDMRLEQRIFNSMKTGANPIILRGLIRMKMTLPKAISLESAYKVNPELFTEKEFVSRMLEAG